MISLFSPPAFPHPLSTNLVKQLGKGCQWLVDRLCGIRKSHVQPAVPHTDRDTTTIGIRVTAAKAMIPVTGPAHPIEAAPHWSDDGMAPPLMVTGHDDEQQSRIEQFTRQCAARKLQRHFREFRKRVANKPGNEFGVKRLENRHPVGSEEETRRRYYFDAKNRDRLIATEKGEDRTDLGLNGSFKSGVIAGKDTLSFFLANPCSPDDDQLPTFLKELDCIVLPRMVSQHRMIIRNAGIELTYAKGPMALKAFERLVSQLDEMHRRGYCHLDIKPANLCINDDRVIRLIDCDGISPTLKTGTLVSTPGYMPATCTGDIATTAHGISKSRARTVLMDRYAMLCSMIETTQASLGLTQPELERFNRVNHARQVFNGILARDPDKQEKYDIRQDHYPSLDQVLEKQFNTWVYARNSASATFIDRWIAKYVKPEYRETVTFLLTHPKLYLEYLEDQPLPLHEMLDWQAN